MKNWLKNWSWKKKIAVVLALLLLVGAVLLFLANLASQRAAIIFNRQMANQKSMRGKVTVERLVGDLTGHVYFEKLRWENEEGEEILRAESGIINVRVLDVIFRRMGWRTLESLELNNARISVYLDDKMRLSFLNPRNLRNEKRLAQVSQGQNKNLQLAGVLPNTQLILNNSKLIAKYGERVFLLNDVNLDAEVTKHRYIRMNLQTGAFGGTMVGDGMRLSGTIDSNGPKSKINMNMELYEVVPESLGLGKVKNPMTIKGAVSGKLATPKIDGAIRMKRLDIPSLTFTNLEGNFVYNSGNVVLEDVTGQLYGGTVQASGLYSFDDRSYHINAVGSGLSIASALKSNRIKGRAELMLRLNNEGKGKKVYTYGSLDVPGGSYMMLPFKDLNASFSNVDRELSFTNVELETAFGTFKTDSLKIIQGKIQVDPIYYYDEKGKHRRLR